MIPKVTIFLAGTALAAAASIDKRIAGGEYAKAGEFPFIVSLRSKWGGHVCGGSLLDSTTVLTAEHCGGETFSVTAGTLNSREGGVNVKVKLWKPYPDYRPWVTDIGILKLSSPIQQSETIGYATLPANGSDPVANSTAIAAGWGARGSETPVYANDGSPVDNLGKVVIPVHAREYCLKLAPFVTSAADSIVCAGGDGKNICKFDSGGPLIDQETGQLIGLTAWGMKDPGSIRVCNLAPSVYTRVSSFLPFINENLGEAGYSGGVSPTSGQISEPSDEIPEPSDEIPEPSDKPELSLEEMKEINDLFVRPSDEISELSHASSEPSDEPELSEELKKKINDLFVRPSSA